MQFANCLCATNTCACCCCCCLFISFQFYLRFWRWSIELSFGYFFSAAASQQKWGRNVNVHLRAAHICWAGTLLRPASPQGVWSLTCGPAKLIRPVTRLALQNSRGSYRNYGSTRGFQCENISSSTASEPHDTIVRLRETTAGGAADMWGRPAAALVSHFTSMLLSGHRRRHPEPPVGGGTPASRDQGWACMRDPAGYWCVLILLPVLLGPFFRLY